MKKIMVTRSSMPPVEEYIEKIKVLWETRWLTNAGNFHAQLIEKLKEYLHIDHFELFANGHLALEIALQALELEGEVITTPFTFLSTTNAIVRNGLTPVFCDIDATTWTLDVEKMKSLITDKTVAILPVHVYGIPCNIEEIEKIAKEHNLKVIYDAAHTFGAKYKGKSFAQFGDMSMFSFHATKVFHTVEGGGLSIRDENLVHKIERLRDFGLRIGGENADYIGTNAKLSEFHSAMGLCNLDHLEEEIAKRKACSEVYDSYLKGVEGVQIFPDIEGLERNYAYYPIVFHKEFPYNRDEIFEKLANENIISRKYFYPLISRMQGFANLENRGETPVAEYIAQNVLCLPMYADLEHDAIEKICKIILDK